MNLPRNRLGVIAMESEQDRVKKIFQCFFIAELNSTNDTTLKYVYPEEDGKEKELQKFQEFCFPFEKSSPSIGKRQQHFTFMLTDLEKRHKYGFCKLTTGKLCYCFVSYFPWFEIFYKTLNLMCAVYSRNDVDTVTTLLQGLHDSAVPKLNEIITIGTSLSFSLPNESDLPSIPENRNLMEYYSAIKPRNMMEIFAALMFERRVMFTSSSLSILTGCIYAAESLINPLSWQHIYIPVLPPKMIDYCSAPMPFLIGVHSSLMPSIEKASMTEGVVLVDIDNNQITTPYNDLETMPSEVVSYLRSLLNKPNVAVSTQLSQAFLKTQARLIGGYRNALKFHMGSLIVFDEQTFVDMHKSSTRRTFAEALVQLQAFQQFIENRLEMLNNGRGFRDAFENEITILQTQAGGNDSTMYKEWLSVTKKGGEIMNNVKKRAKGNMRIARESARQGIKDVKNAMKTSEDEARNAPPKLKSKHSLRENVTSLRPPRPPPPKHRNQKTKQKPPPRPAPPSPASRTIRHYTVIEESEEDDEINDFLSDCDSHGTETQSSSNLSLLDEMNAVLLRDEFSDLPLLIDLSSPTNTQTTLKNAPTDFLVDFEEEEEDKLFGDDIIKPSVSRITARGNSSLFDDNFTGDCFSILPAHRTSEIRRAERVNQAVETPLANYNVSSSSDLLGSITLANLHTNQRSDVNWAHFGSEKTAGSTRSGDLEFMGSQQQQSTRQNINEPLISFDDF